MSKKIIHVITNFSQVGGAEQMLIRAINASSSDISHKVVSLMGISDSMKERVARPVEYISFGANGALSLMLSAIKLSKLYRGLDDAYIYSWMYHANFVAALSLFFRRQKIPLFWGVRHSLDDLKGEGVNTKLAIYAGRLLSFKPDVIIHCSKKSMRQHILFGYGSKSQSIHVPNGYLFPVMGNRTFGVDKCVFGAAGRFHEAKDYRMLFRSLAPILKSNEGSCLKIAGRGMTYDNKVLLGFLKEFDIAEKQVDLLGPLQDMESFYRSIDFFILSSKTEGFPNVLAEASGVGCIAFSTDVGDAQQIIDKARIVDVADAVSMTALIDSYMKKTPNELKGISNDSANHVRKHFSIDVIAKKLFSLTNNN